MRKVVKPGGRAAKPAARRAAGKEAARFCPRFHRAVELIGRRWSGAIIRAMLPGPPVRVSYELTEAGRGLEPVIEALSHWAEHWMTG